MKTKILIALLCASVLLVAGWTSQTAPPKWEYKFVQMKIDFKKTDIALSELGAQGWEVITVNDEGGIANVYLKRPKH